MARLLFLETDKRAGASIKAGDGKIRCPKCKWVPGRHDRWMCSCQHVWNTFDTRGVCPACSRAWRDTMCLRCHQWSPHDDWYAEADDKPD